VRSLPATRHRRIPVRAAGHRGGPAGLVPAAWHRTDRYGNRRIEADHGQLKRRLRPMRGLKTDAGTIAVTAGHAFVQNLRRGHYELAVDQPVQLRVATAFNELAIAI
jgi:IS6 family transposase